MKKRGFTLIELLAVIVILAIIALIAVPIVLGIINDSKKSSEKESVKLYLDTVQKAITKKQMSDPNFQPDKCTIKTDGNLECFNGTTSLGILEISMKGQMPSSGKVIIKDNNITYENIVLNGKIYYEKKSFAAYSIGDKITYEGISYYVLKNSNSDEETVTLLKQTPLTVNEVNVYGGVGTENNYVNKYYCSYSNVPEDCGAYIVNYDDSLGGVEFYGVAMNETWPNTCITYAESHIKQIVDEWTSANTNSSDLMNDHTGYSSRLIDKSDLVNNFAFYNNPDEYSFKKLLAPSTFTQSWLFLGDYIYEWTMTVDCQEQTVLVMSTTEDYGPNVSSNSYVPGDLIDYSSGYPVVRPVITIKKTAQITKLNS